METRFLGIKHTTVAENKVFALYKHINRTNSSDLPVARNIFSQILLVQQYE